MARITAERKTAYQQLQARLLLSFRIAKAKEYDRARAEVARRMAPKLERAKVRNVTRFNVRCEQMAPYVQKHGKQYVTAWIRECLPPYYVECATSVERGGKFNGWHIMRIG